MALIVSLLAHVGVAAIAARHAPPATNATSDAPPEIDLVAPATTRDEPWATEQAAPAAEATRALGVVSPRGHVKPREPLASLPEGSAEPAAAPRVSTSNDGPRFAMTVLRANAASSAAIGSATSAANRAPIAESAAQTPARLKSGNAPVYTAAALAAGVEADVPLELVVSATGAVVSARVVTHVGYGLDEAALESAYRYQFTPAWLDGRTVAVRIRWLMRFQLR